MTRDDPTATGLHKHEAIARGTVLAGRFRVDGLLGVGAMGVVYRADDIALGVPVAVKVLRPELAARPEAFERFRQELLLARQVSDPHVVRIHDIAEDDGRWLISMDFVDGEALDKRLDRDGRLAVDDALRIARQVASGLGAAHARGIVHRDLKPANVLLDRDGNAYVNDFGIARSLADSGRTRSGAILGTPDYLSPEQARGEPVDPRSDLYALGLILYEMLAGELPFASGTYAEALGQRMLRAPPPVSAHRADVPAWVARLIDRLLRPQPGHRFADAGKVVAAIDRREVRREFRPDRRSVLAATLALAVTVAGTAWWWQAKRDQAVAVAASPPLQRLLVLPLVVERGDGDDAALGLAAGDLLRDAIAGAGVAVVDAARTWQTWRQLDPAGVARVDAGAMRAVAAADRSLRLRLAHDQDGWRAGGELQAGDAAPRMIECPRTNSALAAWRACLAPLAQALDLPASALAALPPEPALVAYGEGLRARQDGDPAAAQRAFAAAVAASPRFLQASLAQAESAVAVGDAAAASMILEVAARDTAAPERLRLQVTAARAMLDGDAALAQRNWRSLLQAQPNDTHAALQLALAQAAGGDPGAASVALRALAGRDDNDPRVWFELGKLSILQGDARRAVDEELLRALLLYRRSGDGYGLAETVNALGVGYGRLGQTAEAERQYREAVERRAAIGNRRGVATSLGNLAAVLALRGAFDEAEAALDRARAIHVELGNRAGLAATENEIGLLAEERGDHRTALEAYRRALSAWRQAGDAHGEAETLNHIGFAHHALGAYDSAQAFWLQAAEAYARLGDLTGDVRTTQNLALLDIARGDGDAARAKLLRALDIAEGQQMVEEAAVSRRNLAELALLQGRVAEALEHSDKAGAAFRQRDDLRGATDAALLRVQALLAAGADGPARDALQALGDEPSEASVELQALAALLHGDLLARARDTRGAQSAWREAAALADAAGVRDLQLRIALRRDPASSSLDADTAALGRFGLRLSWLEQALLRARQAGDAETGGRMYQEARTLLRGREYARAYRLHGLGAAMLATAGNTDAAAAAREEAAAALDVVREALPAALRADFDAQPEVAEVIRDAGMPGTGA